MKAPACALIFGHYVPSNVDIKITDRQNVNIQFTNRQNVDIQVTNYQNVDFQVPY
jgi:hypothetical protein